MSRLREASRALARTGAHPVLPVERLFAIERIAAGLETRRIARPAPWLDLADQARDDGLGSLPIADLRRLLRPIWADRAQTRLAGALVERLAEDARRSTDRALITSYLVAYPVDHPAFERLRAAAAAGADRHAWQWREAGRAWQLWDGPAAFGKALKRAVDGQALLRDAGLVGSLADGGFVSAARRGAASAAP